jgi:hypothetical protein
VFALLGLVGDRKQDLELVKVIDYIITTWQLLLAILATKAIRRPLEFVAHYSSRVMEEQDDMRRTSAVSLEFDVYMPYNHLQENFDNQPYSRTEMQRFSIYMDSTKRNTDYIDERVYIDRCPATHKEQLSGLLYLQADTLNDHYDDWRICALVEDCGPPCKTPCSGYAIIGFSKVHLYINLFFGQLPPLCTGRQTTVIESSTEPGSSVGREKYIQNMLREFRDTRLSNKQVKSSRLAGSSRA